MDHHRRNHHHHQRVKRESLPSGVKIVFVTAKPTFTGKPAGYSTLYGDNSESPAATETQGGQKSDDSHTTQQASQTVKAIVGTPKFIGSSAAKTTGTDALTSISSLPTTFQTSYISNTLSSKSTSTSTSASTSTSIPSSISSSNSKQGSSSGSIGGAVGGTIAGLFALFLIAAFLYRKHKQNIMNKAYGKPEDEKLGIIGDDVSKDQSAPPPLSNLNTAPAPPLGTTGFSGRSGSQEITRKPVPAPLNLVKEPAADKSKPNQNSTNDAAIPAAQRSPSLSAFSDGQYTVPGTPSSSTSVTMDPNPVHRIIIEFLPSMPDELELRAGGLVRMLHEYDDGWALCTRLDRSQQGVCPRTCLSANAVKPRPRPKPGSTSGGNNGSNAQHGSRSASPPNGGPPTQNPNRPNSPSPQYFPQPQTPGSQKNQSRPQSPASIRRPETPTARRPQTPLPQITVSPSPEPATPASPAKSPLADNGPMDSAPQPKDSSPLAQQSPPDPPPAPALSMHSTINDPTATPTEATAQSPFPAPVPGPTADGPSPHSA